jgi:Ca2+-transporting ATPase
MPASVFTLSTFDSRKMNRAAIVEFVLAVFTTQLDGFRRILGTTQIDVQQFAWALNPAIVLLALLGARHADRARSLATGARRRLNHAS